MFMSTRAPIWIIASLALSCAHAGAEGAFQSGDNLLELCAGKEIGICLGYVEAIADAMSEKGPSKSPQICVSHDVTGRQVLGIVISFLRANPSMRHYSASPLVKDALEEAFPCQP
jgi:Rap1a immunity proteins